MLDLRGLYFADRPDTTQGEGTVSMHGFSDIRFTTSIIVGNLGATISATSDGCYAQPAPRASDADSGELGGSVSEETQDTEEWEWYDDEEPVFAADPFSASMAMDVAELAPFPTRAASSG